YFGSVTQLIITSVVEMSNRRFEVYETELEKCTSLHGLLETFLRVFEDDRKTSSFEVLSQFVSGSKNNEEVAKHVEPIFSAWIALSKKSLEKVIDPKTLPAGTSLDDIAMFIMSALLGIQFMATIPEFE